MAIRIHDTINRISPDMQRELPRRGPIGEDLRKLNDALLYQEQRIESLTREARHYRDEALRLSAALKGIKIASDEALAKSNVC
jgi:predicted ribosome quality control (RQC) complex YloA/Tae2 family protein